MDASLGTVLRDNVLALLEHRTGPLRPNETGLTRLVKLGLSAGSAQRALAGETSLGLEILKNIAVALQVEVWQLLVPDLDPVALPGLTVDQGAWPFEMVDRNAYRALSATDRTFRLSRARWPTRSRTAAARLGNAVRRKGGGSCLLFPRAVRNTGPRQCSPTP